MRFLSLLALTLALGVSPAHAEEPGIGSRYLGTFGYWRAFQVTEDNHPVCYMSLAAKAPDVSGIKTKDGKSVGATKRGEITILITHRPTEGALDVVSYSAGTKLKAGGSAKIIVDKKSFSLFTQNDTAWSRDTSTDHALAQAIAAGSSLSFLGESISGKLLADAIDLKGAGKAYYAIGKACGLAVKEPAKAPTPKITTPKSKKK